MIIERLSLSHKMIVEELNLYFYGNIDSFKQLLITKICVGFSGCKDEKTTAPDNLLKTEHGLVCKENN